MKASVVIPTYNREHILSLSLTSLCNQASVSADDFEVIICDDGSSDNTRQMVEAFSDCLDIKYFFQEDKGYRVSLARNTGIRAAKHEVIILLDSGVVVSSNFVDSHLKQHSDKSTNNVVIGYIYGYNYTMRSDDLTDEFDFDNPDLTIKTLQECNLHLDVREDNYRLVSDKLADLPAPWTLFWTTNVSFGKDFVEEVGLFEERFESWGVEDVELGYRLYINGGSYMLSRSAAGLHYPHERDVQAQKQSNSENRSLLYKLHPDNVIEHYLGSTALKFNFEYKDTPI